MGCNSDASFCATGLTEDMAWPARPQDTYGLEKLYAEEMCLAYAKDFPIKTRVARYHNVYGPRGTWKGEFPFPDAFHAGGGALACRLVKSV